MSYGFNSGVRNTRCVLAIVAVTLTVGAFIAVPVAAQDRFELSGFFGYIFSDGVDVNRSTQAGEFIDELVVASGAGYGGAFNFWIDRQITVGVQLGFQDSGLEVRGSTDRALTGMTVGNYHAVVTFHGGTSNSQFRPFVLAGLGGTQYRPSDLNGASFDNELKFSGTLGGGVKAYMNDNVGVSFTGRWTPTYINSNAAGLYCSPYWVPFYPGGCAVLTEPVYGNQLDFSAGIILRF